jgi:WD40 repeat protein
MSDPIQSPPPPASPAPLGRWQFTLGGFFMFVTLVAILLTFLRTEGCGRPFVKIGSVEFSPDGKRLAVAKYNARDAQTPLKLYLTDVSRTISIVNVETASAERVIEQTVKTGNQGPAFSIYGYVSNCIGFGPCENTLLVTEYGGRRVYQFDLTSGQKRLSAAFPDEYVNALLLSRDRSLVAIGRSSNVALSDAKSGKTRQSIIAEDMPFKATPIMAVSFDNRLVATAGGSGVLVWDIAKRSCLGSIRGLAPDKPIRAIVFSPTDGRLAIGLDGEVRVYDSGNIKLSKRLSGGEEWLRSIAFSPDGKTIAAAQGKEVALFDSATGRSLTTLQGDESISSLAYSPDGARLAVGDYAGRVALWTPGKNTPPTMIDVPGRAGHPWPYSVIALFLWLFAYFKLRQSRRRAAAQPQADDSPQQERR